MGRDAIGNSDGAAHFLRILRERVAPGAIGSIFQDMARFMYFGRPVQNMGTYLMELDMLRRKAGARFRPLRRGHGSATLTENGKTLVLASVRNSPALPEVPAQMRRLSGSRGNAT